MSRSVYQRPVGSGYGVARLVALLLIGALLAVVVSWRGGDLVTTRDSDRFRDQALSIQEGRGFSTYGVPETVLPPGYSLFLASIMLVNAEWAIGLVQVVFFVCAVLLLFMACSNGSTFGTAGCLAGLLAINVWAAKSCVYMLSETMGLLLSSSVVFLASRGLSGRPRVLVMLLGAFLLFLPLTSPATQPLCFFVALAAVTTTRSSRELAWFLGAAAMPFLLWQWHCVSSSGRVGFPLYTTNIAIRNSDPIVSWVRGWATSERDLRWVWQPDDVASLPDRAFRSEEERARIVTALMQIRDGGIRRVQAERTLMEAAQGRESDDWFRNNVLLPLLRAKSLWLRMPQIGHMQQEYVLRLGVGTYAQDRRILGASRARARLAKAVASTLGYLLWVCIPVLFLLACFFPSKDRVALSTAIIAGVVLYTAVSAYGALGEARRNLVFYPPMLLVVASSRLFEISVDRTRRIHGFVRKDRHRETTADFVA